MKIEGKITLLIGSEYTTIRLEDEVASTVFCEVTLTPQQLSDALSRLANTSCDIKLYGLDKLGKKHEHDTFVFRIPDKISRNDRDKLREIANSMLSDGWTTTDSFSSQGSFFTRNGDDYAQCTIRRWV